MIRFIWYAHCIVRFMSTYDTPIWYRTFSTRYDMYRVLYDIDNYGTTYLRNFMSPCAGLHRWRWWLHSKINISPCDVLSLRRNVRCFGTWASCLKSFGSPQIGLSPTSNLSGQVGSRLENTGRPTRVPSWSEPTIGKLWTREPLGMCSLWSLITHKELLSPPLFHTTLLFPYPFTSTVKLFLA